MSYTLAELTETIRKDSKEWASFFVNITNKLDDLHSMLSALSPTQEIKKEDYDRLVARSAKEAETLKKASDSLPTPKRAKKEESS